jgi:hypothetical protein
LRGFREGWQDGKGSIFRRGQNTINPKHVFEFFKNVNKKHQGKLKEKHEDIQRVNTSTILPLGRPPPKAKSNVKQPLGKVSLQCTKCDKINHLVKSNRWT